MYLNSYLKIAILIRKRSLFIVPHINIGIKLPFINKGKNAVRTSEINKHGIT